MAGDDASASRYPSFAFPQILGLKIPGESDGAGARMSMQLVGPVMTPFRAAGVGGGDHQIESERSKAAPNGRWE